MRIWVQILSIYVKPASVVVYVCDPSIGEVEAGRSPELTGQLTPILPVCNVDMYYKDAYLQHQRFPLGENSSAGRQR